MLDITNRTFFDLFGARDFQQTFDKGSENNFFAVYIQVNLVAVADPGFLRGGTPTPKVGAQTYYLITNFPKTAWKW